MADEAYLLWRAEVAKELRSAGRDHQADHLENCGKFIGNFGMLVCSSYLGHKPRGVPFYCNLPCCQHCQRVNQAKRKERYTYKFGELLKLNKPTWSLKSVVLTTKHQIDDPDAKTAYRTNWKHIKRFLNFYYLHALANELTPDERRRGRVDLNAHDVGALVAIEYGETKQRLHSHLILNGPYVDKKVIGDCWRRATYGESYIVHVRKIKPEKLDREINEQVKYVTKFQTLTPQHAVRLLEILDGEKRLSRRIRAYGRLRSIKMPPEEKCKCSICSGDIQRINLDTYYNLCIERNIPVDPEIVALTPDGIRKPWLVLLDLIHRANVGDSQEPLISSADDLDALMTSLRERVRHLARSDTALELVE